MTALAASPAPNDSAVVRHHGRLNLAVAPVIRQQLVDLVAEGNTRIVVDLADVEVIGRAFRSNGRCRCDDPNHPMDEWGYQWDDRVGRWLDADEVQHYRRRRRGWWRRRR